MAKGRWIIKTVPATTNNLTTAIINHLKAHGHAASRINTQGQYDEEKQIWRKSGSTRGVSDIIACLAPTGRMFAVEVKKGRDRVRDGQTDWLAEQAAAGALTFIAKSYEEYLNFYNAQQL